MLKHFVAHTVAEARKAVVGYFFPFLGLARTLKSYATNRPVVTFMDGRALYFPPGVTREQLQTLIEPLASQEPVRQRNAS